VTDFIDDCVQAGQNTLQRKIERSWFRAFRKRIVGP